MPGPRAVLPGWMSTLMWVPTTREVVQVGPSFLTSNGRSSAMVGGSAGWMSWKWLSTATDDVRAGGGRGRRLHAERDDVARETGSGPAPGPRRRAHGRERDRDPDERPPGVMGGLPGRSFGNGQGRGRVHSKDGPRSLWGRSRLPQTRAFTPTSARQRVIPSDPVSRRTAATGDELRRWAPPTWRPAAGLAPSGLAAIATDTSPAPVPRPLGTGAKSTGATCPVTRKPLTET